MAQAFAIYWDGRWWLAYKVAGQWAHLYNDGHTITAIGTEERWVALDD